MPGVNGGSLSSILLSPEYSVNEREVEIAVQVMGKIRDRIVVAADAGQDAIREKALASERVREAMGKRQPKKVIVVKSRLVNIVTYPPRNDA